MREWIKFVYHRFREQLWAKPAAICCLSVAAVFMANAADKLVDAAYVPDVSVKSVETLLEVIAASMLVMAIFAVGSMVSAYDSASNNATPRAFPLILSDDVSQNALTAFIGAFIFSIVALFALQNGFYDRTGRFILLLMTFFVFGVVILTFVWWVDRIARLGRMGATIDKVETTTATALKRRRRLPRLGGKAVSSRDANWVAIHGKSHGYVQLVQMATLQSIAEEHQTTIEVAALPGAFASPARPMVFIPADCVNKDEIEHKICDAIVIGKERTFEDDPRFGMVVLSQIASRALSPAVNDTGTAISVVDALVRLLILWSEPISSDEKIEVEYDRVEVPELILEEIYDDAFTMIERDGASAVEVVVRLQKAFEALSALDDAEFREVALSHARMTLSRAEAAMDFSRDLELVKKAAEFASLD